jgi:RNA polymerase sigma factor (sigma-70 family)
MEVRSDETLLRLYALHRDEAAFREVARRYGGLVYGACLHHLSRPELAEDAAQAVFLTLARKAGRVRIKTSLVPWLYEVAKRECRGVLRAERRRSSREMPLDEAIPAPTDHVDEALFGALDALTGPEREVIVLRFVQGLSLAEVGKTQGISEDAARMRIQRALGRLRREYVPTVSAPLPFLERLASLALPKPSPIMTPPTLLATGGLASIALIGVVSVGTRTLSRAALPNEVVRPTPQSSVPPSRPASQALPPAKTKAALPPLLDVAPFEYRGALTIQGTLVERDLWSDEMMIKRADQWRKEAKERYPEGPTRDRILESIDSTVTDRVRESKFRITFETDGPRFRFECLNAAQPSALAVNNGLHFYDGTSTYMIRTTKDAVLKYPGLHRDVMIGLPLFGQGFAFRPLVKPYQSTGAEVWPPSWPKGYELCLAAPQSRLNPVDDYRHGIALADTEVVGGRSALKSILHGLKGKASEEWIFSEPVVVGGHIFAKQVLWKGFEQNRKGEIVSQRYEKIFRIDRIEAKVNASHLDYRNEVEPGVPVSLEKERS